MDQAKSNVTDMEQINLEIEEYLNRYNSLTPTEQQQEDHKDDIAGKKSRFKKILLNLAVIYAVFHLIVIVLRILERFSLL
ncbi:hypothetical protein [Paenibacillus jiagnxiensis]|uniref:hypothetical protein n=1 Tax=Paenibacillus jiagnxiensis TaxID=3228926 RepID=UPI0033A524B6